MELQLIDEDTVKQSCTIFRIEIGYATYEFDNFVIDIIIYLF